MNRSNITISKDIAEYVFSLEFGQLPDNVIHEVKRRLIDSFGCALGAYNCEPSRIARRIAKRVQCDRGATLFGTDHKTTPELATFVNGILFRYLDYNDTYLSKEPAHPSDNIPAALAVAEWENLDGKEIITAIALGYEIQCRFCDAVSLRARGWDHVGYVSIASALVASKLMGLGQEEIEHAISLSIAPNVTLRQTRVGELSMWKGCAAANAARNGVFAATLAREGITGPSNIFDGEKGFFNQVTGSFPIDTNNFGGRSDHFKILDSYIKYYPSEYHSQAGVEAALELRGMVKLDDIEEINIETYDACVDIIAGEEEKWNPQTRETADHSLPYCVAVALFDGRVGLEQFSEERIKDPKLQKFLKKIKVKRNADHNKQYPAAFPCFIEIKCASGKRVSKTVTYPKGHPQNPLTDEEVVDKFARLNNGLLDSSKVRGIVDVIWGLENLGAARDLMTLTKI